MYRIGTGKLAYVPATLFAVLGASLGMIWTWGGPSWLFWGAAILPFLLEVRYLTNQFQTIDPAAGTRTVPRVLFLRETLRDRKLTATARAVTNNGVTSYSVAIEGDFGNVVLPLPDYDAYVTLVYKRQATALGLV